MQKKEYWTDKLTPQKLCAVFFIQFNEGYQINVILPFIVFMIRDFGFGENVVGLYSGLLIATFALCQFISSYFWGYLSSYFWGRKICLLTGSIFSGFAIIIFGTSTTYAQAVVARCIAGIFNGNIGVARAYVADITNGNNRAFAFSTFAIAFIAGMILGSICGGALIQTSDLDDNGTHYKKTESILQFGIFHTQFPYLLPCVIGCIISITSFILTFLYIKDVDVEVYFSLDELDELDEPCSRSLPLYSIGGIAAATTTTPTSTPSHYAQYRENETNSLIDFENMVLDTAATSIIDCHAMGTNALHDGVESIKSYKAEKGKLLSLEDIDSLKSLFNKTPIIHALFTNVTLMLMLVTWNEMIPLLLAQSLHLDALSIGIYSAYNGVILFIFTWYIQPVLLKKFKLKELYIGFGIGMLVILIGLPSVALIPNIIEWNVISIVALTSFIGAFKFAFSTSLFVVSLVFVNNSVPPQAMSRANGLTQAFGSALRGLGPLIGGALWSWSVTLQNPFTVYIAYIFMWIPTAYSVIHCYCFIQKDIQKTWTQRYNN